MNRSAAAHPRARQARPAHRPDPRVLRPVRQLALAGLALVLVWPAARGYNAWIGWWPLWLAGMPMTAWWALHRFALPRWGAPAVRPQPRRRRMPQARRRVDPVRGWARAA